MTLPRLLAETAPPGPLILTPPCPFLSPTLTRTGRKQKPMACEGKKLQRLLKPLKNQVQEKGRQGAKVESQRGMSHLFAPLPPAPRSAPAKPSPNSGSKSTSVGEVSVYVDLAYIPSGASSPTISVDFFRCVRSACSIISGDSPEKEEIMRQTLDALLDAKISWPDTMQVTLIPTLEAVPMQEWYQQTLENRRSWA
ncbi:hypothetical protein CgunFtcFv8_005023 [Champsocephalus gunnari]|uniref:Uncharacterized protein n=1 Tax=Champsocephalus gunnari TaxID=52237 RepID=A0AAN8HCB1_CHAGU|nr:hypothetical protein CgunFtcFv8_005023 [Champsocephalus gunnari]